ncbi:hypothetical protein R1flu_004984 [Riccia fluitans]|uniref:Uncharacterized protein n=1 Tax=Riccia fluitans TaxID=41844 RepID=A0ABD1YSN4_9MARC
MTNERIRPSRHYPYTSEGKVFTSIGKCFASIGERFIKEVKSGMRGDALAATLPPLAKRSPMEAKAGYSWQSPSQGFASIGERWPPKAKGLPRVAPTGLASPSLAKTSPMKATFLPRRHVDFGTSLPPSAIRP